MNQTQTLPRRITRLLSLLVALAGFLSQAAGTTHAQARPLGDMKMFASFPADPGFPEGIAVNGDRVYVSGAAQFGHFLQPRVVAYDIRTGAQVADHAIFMPDPLFFGVFDVYVNDKADKLATPHIK